MTSENRANAAAVILFIAVFADISLRLSAPGFVAAGGLVAFLAYVTSLALLFVRVVKVLDLPAALAVALFGMHPATVVALSGNGHERVVAALTGMCAAIVICRWESARWWRRWACFLPAVPCILLHRVGVAFAPLLAASIWLYSEEIATKSRTQRILECWPALVVSALASFMHRGEGFHAGPSVVALPQMLGSFLAPFAPSLSSGWSTLDGLVTLAAVAGVAIATASVWRLPAVSFGLALFLVMALVAPTEPLAALPGLALAAAAALVAASAPFLEARPSWLRVESDAR